MSDSAGRSLVTRATPFENLPDPFDQKALKLCEKMGVATMRWQHVEASLYCLFHVLSRSEHAVSSLTYFHIFSNSSRIDLMNKLIRLRSPAEPVLAKWKELKAKAIELAVFRNAVVHFEMQLVTVPDDQGGASVDMILGTSHLDLAKNADPNGKCLTVQTVEELGSEFLKFSREILEFIIIVDPAWQSRTKDLPPALQQILQNAATADGA